MSNMAASVVMDLRYRVTEIVSKCLGSEDKEGRKDYFSWGRDPRHKVDTSESLPPEKALDLVGPGGFWRSMFPAYDRFRNRRKVISRFDKRFGKFEASFQLMSDEYSRNLFAELIAIKLISEHWMNLSSFTKEFVDSYEVASNTLIASGESYEIYDWILKRADITDPSITIFTTPSLLNLHYSGKLYRYQGLEGVVIQVEQGDIVIDAGIGWADTTIYLAALASGEDGGWVYSFDILQEGISALLHQRMFNPHIKNISVDQFALSDKDGESMFVVDAGPGAKVVGSESDRRVTTLTIDSFCRRADVTAVNFIKMDIEGSELAALTGAKGIISSCKPKLAISVYHKWDDLLKIPLLIHSFRDDYEFFLDCTTGFGGEAILYCK